MSREISSRSRELLQRLQRQDHTDYLILQELAKHIDDPENHDVLERIAEERHARHEKWREITGEETEPNRPRVRLYALLAHVLGLTFAVKYMERDEERAHAIYEAVQDEVPEAERIVEEEEAHELELVDMLDEERLHYTSSIVLGLVEGIVNLIGHLSGLTLALRDTQMIGLTGLITGLAASFALLSSEYLSIETGENEQEPGKASLYSGGSSVLALVLLLLPFWFTENYFVAIAGSLGIAILMIAALSYYLSVTRELHFGRRFARMGGISLGVAALSFVVGIVVHEALGPNL